MLNNLYGAAFDGAEWDEEQNPDDDMLFHLEDLFPGATVHQHAGNRTLTIEQPLVFELNAVGPGAVGQELNNGGAAGRQLPPPLAISSSHPLLSRPPPSSDPGQPTPAGQSGRIGSVYFDNFSVYSSCERLRLQWQHWYYFGSLVAGTYIMLQSMLVQLMYG